MDVTVATGTFGHTRWTHLARTRAWPSVVREKVPWVHVHGDSLAHARNRALAGVETEWVCFLDADDSIEPGFCEAMSQGSADVRVPILRFVHADGRERNLWQPRVAGHAHDCEAGCVTSGAGNWIPAGTVARTELVRGAGGWREWPVYEDFDLWMRVLLLGASVELVRDAVYRAWVNPQGRNRAPAMTEKNRVHHEIVAANLGEVAA